MPADQSAPDSPMTRQARLPASAKLLADERTSLPSPHTLYFGPRPTHISSALNATELSTHSDPTLLVLLPFACVQQFPGAVSHFTEASCSVDRAACTGLRCLPFERRTRPHNSSVEPWTFVAGFVAVPVECRP